mgnify:FL=1
MDPKQLIQKMLKITQEAAQQSMKYFGKVRAHLKADQSLVTKADEEIQGLLFLNLSGLIPNSGFIGEENRDDSNTLALARRAEYTWVVDPIDGTAVFSSGIPTFGISVGLLRDGLPFAGAIVFPALGLAYYALKGLGAFKNGELISVQKILPPLDGDYICLSRNAHQYFDIIYPGKILIFGSTTYNFSLVAEGAVVGAIGRSHVWDHAATSAIICEAGGVVRHQDGSEIDWRKALNGELILPPVTAASPQLWDRVAGGAILRNWL